MSHSEFDIIARYFNKTQSFTHKKNRPPKVLLGSGDDCALLPGPNEHAIAVSVDNLVQGRHFFHDAAPEDLGHKALAAALSDLTAMGASSYSALLCLTLPTADEAWLEAFSHGFYSLAEKYQVSLIGGNIAAGPLNIAVTVIGQVPALRALKRSGAQTGDIIYIIGEVGAAAAALANLQGQFALTVAEQKQLLPAWTRPEPLCPIAPLLLDYASSSIDISDGLLADLQHILTASDNKGAIIQAEHLPLPALLKNNIHRKKILSFALNGGEDYALCITVPATLQKKWDLAAAQTNYRISAIGHITHDKKIQVIDSQGHDITPQKRGWMHFK